MEWAVFHTGSWSQLQGKGAFVTGFGKGGFESNLAGFALKLGPNPVR
jgi:hypothetical protein